jgi:hypothetical protein
MTGWRWATIEVGTPAMGASAITPTRHRMQWSRVSFRVNGGKRRFQSNLAKDLKSMVSSSTPHCLYNRGKTKRPYGIHIRESAQWARRLDFFPIRATQSPSHYEWGPGPHVNNINPTGVARQQGRRVTTLRGVCGLYFIDEVTPTNQQHGVTPHGGSKLDKEF